MRVWGMRFAAAAVASLTAAFAANAQEAPALAKASPAEKARLQGLIAEALKEGQLTYLETLIQPATHDVLSAAFRGHFGLPASFKVNHMVMTPGNVITRVEQEERANRVTIDLAALASPAWTFERVREGKVMHYESPQYDAYAKAFDLKIGQKGYFVFNAAYCFVPLWNEDNLKFTGTSWKDVLTAVPPTRLSMGDPSVSDAALMKYIGERQILGLDYFEELARLKPAFLYKSEIIVSRLVSGEDLMTFSGMPSRAWQVNQKGAKIRWLLPKDGWTLIGQTMHILKAAPHPAAAKLWLDFVLSEEGQTIIGRMEGTASGRASFKPPVEGILPPIEQINAITVDWEKVTPDVMQKYRAEWAGIYKKK